jgi:hypothetical protein
VSWLEHGLKVEQKQYVFVSAIGPSWSVWCGSECPCWIVYANRKRQIRTHTGS